MEKLKRLGIIGALGIFILGVIMLATENLTGSIFLILFIIFVFFLIMFNYGNTEIHERQQREQLKKLQDQLKGSNSNANSLPILSYITQNKSHAVKVDRDAKVVTILTNKFAHYGEPSKHDRYEYIEKPILFKDILETRIVEDGVTVTKTSRKSQLAGAALGGLLAGKTGSIIGGLSGSTTSTDEIKSLELYIIVNSFDEPIIKIPFFKSTSYVKKNNEKYKTAFNEVEKSNTVLGTLIKTEDKDDIRKESPQIQESISNAGNSNLSISDEINKLVELKNNNHITEDEFKKYKEKLLK